MSENNPSCVCRVPDSMKWDGQELSFADVLFVKARVTSFLHMPLNYGAVMERVLKKVSAAGALPTEFLCLTDENSLWGSDIYVAVTKEIADATMGRIDGKWLAKIFTGPYSDVLKWIAAMRDEFQKRGRDLGKMLFYYATCPRCAKKFGKNYVVVLGLLS